MKRAIITVSGRVQGVGFRYYVKDLADRHGVAGTVCNVRDGSVVIEAEGESSLIHEFIHHLQLDQGPMRAQIERVDVQWPANLMGYSDFSIVRSR